MISPINTIIENCTDRTVNYRFSSAQIYLCPAGTEGSRYVCSGDLFTRMENNVESELLAIDALNGRITISYECDDRFVMRDADKSPLVLSMSARNKIKGAQKVAPLTMVKPAPLIGVDTAAGTAQNPSIQEVAAVPVATATAPAEKPAEAMTLDGVRAPEDLPMGNPADRAYAGMFEQTKVPVTDMKTVDMVSSKKTADNPLDGMAGHPDTLKVVDIGADKPKRGRRQVK